MEGAVGGEPLVREYKKLQWGSQGTHLVGQMDQNTPNKT